ncbi:ABC-three component system protein [Syntrophobacter fumaroxidans]|nr:ABC-three component system protein [Syntrophobacter fumaroxidans]
MRRKKIERSPTQAPGQYLGYSLQTTRLLARLLDALSEHTISLEVFEDVGAEREDGTRTAEQVKSAIFSNPVSDRAEGLWKTFANWIDAVTAGALELDKTYFEIYVSKVVPAGIAKQFSDAATLEEAVSAFQEAKAILGISKKGSEPLRGISDTLRPYLAKVFEADESVISRIIFRFKLVFGSGSPVSDLAPLLKRTFVPDDMVDDAIRYSLGWVKEKTDKLLEKGVPANILVEEFRKDMISFERAHDNRTILTSYAQEPSRSEIERDLKVRQYVRQLEIIEASYGQKIMAVKDYLLSSADRTLWSAKGLVHRTSFDKFESKLVRTWENLKQQTEIALKDKSAVERGKYLYSDCGNQEVKLEGLEVPPHFTPGSFHALADDLKVGWHPEYEKNL